MNIGKVAVIGAGVMGAGIAAQISNAGVPVYLLDIVPEAATNRHVIAESAINRLLKADPPALMAPKNAALIKPGNLEDNLDWLSDADWVIEVIIENPKAKQALYQKLASVCRKDALISSNTSTLPLALLTRGFDEDFCSRFMITHFFNPPRYMRLLELVTSTATRPELVEAVDRFADTRLGKSCVLCKDTPGFIGNRIGIYWLQTGLLEAIAMGLSVEEADAVISAPFGIPKTGIFGLLDLVGLDLIPAILGVMKQALKYDDAFQPICYTPDLVQHMIADGYTGRKGKGGFYRLNDHGPLPKGEGEQGRRDFQSSRSGATKIKESIDLLTRCYKASTKPRLACLDTVKQGGLRALLACDDKTALYAWRVWSSTLVYAAGLVPEISDDITAVDEAMKMGYNWAHGPFALIDQIGVDYFTARLRAENRPIPPLLQAGKPLYQAQAGQPYYLDTAGAYRPLQRRPGIRLLSDYKLQAAAVLDNASASLWDIGDGVACLEFHSKMNTLDMDSMALIQQSIAKAQTEFAALVIYNEGDNFSAGANLGLLMSAIHRQAWHEVAGLITQGQQTYQALKYAPFPVVGAPAGLALGGGCEILLHCDAIQAHAELYVGLVETGVGLVPGWGGCKEYLRRCLEQPKRFGGPIPPLSKAFETIGTAKVSRSAAEAQSLLFLAKSDGITMNRNRLLMDAKTRALALCQDYAAPTPYAYALPGKTARIACSIALQGMRLIGKATPYDVVVTDRLADVLSGGACDITQPLSEQDILDLEREAFVQLTQQPGTLARLEHMLKTGKPLRN
ncbi:MAG: 3-hydroxyacyl-CoA dehydrogenase/enoyl-CoA hydratase family protein [Methylococcaceae bacterium]|nr:MAG: 3-hydroxyacyl-CoA dehydrogenase/enoyl-CoA hydratase family protein [Methylococcaceae bacterium]